MEMVAHRIAGFVAIAGLDRIEDTLVFAERDGRKVFGIGIDDDIATASVKAVLNAASNS